jgi:L,D-transpeptidase YcbB
VRIRIGHEVLAKALDGPGMRKAAFMTMAATERVRGRKFTGLGVLAALCFVATPVAAFDPSIQFGPTGDGPGGVDTSGREFVKEWEGNPPPGFPTLSPANIAATRAAVKRYEDIVAAGGWQPVPDVELKFGQTHFAVSVLRDRLVASGDLKEESSTPEDFDGYVEKAVKRFQASNGLTPTGAVDKRTIAALNIPAAARLKQLKTNLGRMQEYSGIGKTRYVVVNIPAAQIEAVEGNHVVARYAGVVGKPDRPTPLLRSSISEMNFNPVWRLPPTVINKDLIPRGREMQGAGKNVLVKFGIDAYDGSGKKVDPVSIDWNSSQPFNLSYRQQPGKDNPMGFLKINFNSEQSVYMHDTPSEGIFGRNFRAASSGCIRVHNIEQLALWLLRDNSGWNEGRIEEIKQRVQRLDVRLKKAVPLYFVYVTAWATEDGVVQFRRDLYNRDGVGETAAAY